MKNSWILYMFFVVLISCGKNKELPDTISLGEEEGMSVTYSGKVLSVNTQNEESFFIIDLDQDGINDIRLRYRQNYFPVIGLSHSATVEALHTDCMLLTYQEVDTTYFLQGVQNTVDQFGNPISIQATNYSCSKDSQFASVFQSKTEDKLVPLSSGASLSNTDNFRSVGIDLIGMDSSIVTSTGVIIDGTEIVEMKTFRNACIDFPLDVFRYIGVRITKTNEPTRLGWVKFQLSDDRIEINSYAIQVGSK